MNFHSLQLESQTIIGRWFKKRPKRGLWYLEWHYAFKLCSREDNISSIRTSMEFYRWLLQLKTYKDLAVSLSFNIDELIDLFRKTFGPK